MAHASRLASTEEGQGPGQAPTQQWHKCGGRRQPEGRAGTGTLVLDDLLGQARVAFATDDDGAGVARPGYITGKREPTSALAPAAGVGRTGPGTLPVVLDGLRLPVLGQTCVAFAADDDAPAGPASESRVRTLSLLGKREELPRNGSAQAGGGGRSIGDERGWEEAEGRTRVSTAPGRHTGKSRCKDCCGSGLCAHGRQRSKCKECPAAGLQVRD